MNHLRINVAAWAMAVVFLCTVVLGIQSVSAQEAKPEYGPASTPMEAIAKMKAAMDHRDIKSAAYVLAMDEADLKTVLIFMEVSFKAAEAGENMVPLINKKFGKVAALDFLESDSVMDTHSGFALDAVEITLSEDGSTAKASWTEFDGTKDGAHLFEKDGNWYVDFLKDGPTVDQLKEFTPVVTMLAGVLTEAPRVLDMSKDYEQFQELMDEVAAKTAEKMGIDLEG